MGVNAICADPLDRDPALVGKEITQGQVRVEGAKEYGEIVSTSGAVDTAATEALRTTLRATRPALEHFNYGPSIDDLRKSCVDDTGLPARLQPVWPTLETAE